MSKTIYILPVPSTALLADPVFEERIRRTCALICEYDSEKEEKNAVLTMIFEDLAVFKCSYYGAYGSEMHNAYDKVLDFGASEWLKEIKGNLAQYEINNAGLKHLAIYFDDGPAYEFICRGFHTEIELKPYVGF